MDNAFERACAAYGTGAYDDATLEFLFPQLKESEDGRNERMRKRVIESLVCYRGKVYDEGDKVVASMVDEEIIWMRKQKEQDECPEYCVRSHCIGCSIYEKQKEQKPADEQFPPLEGLDAIKAKYYDDGFKNGFDEGVASVKPAEWSKEDNIGWDEAFACVTRAEKAAKNEEELQSAVTAEKWLKEIKFKYYVHPVKQEWSEEDEKKIIELKTFIARCNGFNKENRKKAFDMIDAIGPKPSWKPSEEQMEALKKVAYSLIGSGTETDIHLAELYEQLKQL